MAKHPTTSRSHENIEAAADADTHAGALSAAAKTAAPGPDAQPGPDDASPSGKRPSLEARVAAIEAILRAQGHNLP